jgi:hypothetical protein
MAAVLDLVHSFDWLNCELYRELRGRLCSA